MTLKDYPLYGISKLDFANLFCPNSELCDAIMDVILDKYRFICYPVNLTAVRSAQVRALYPLLSATVF
jgi:hypothetical protein